MILYTWGMIDPKSYRTGTKATARASGLAKGLRRALTPPEKRLWKVLKGKKVDGLHFRTQVAVGRYIADFYCHAARLVIEVDGESHRGERLVRDRERDRWMADRGIRVLRFPARELVKNLEGVVGAIRCTAREQLELREREKGGL